MSTLMTKIQKKLLMQDTGIFYIFKIRQQNYEDAYPLNDLATTVNEGTQFILVKYCIDENIKAKGVVFLDRNKKHFSGRNDLKKVLVEKGYKLVADIFGAVSAEILLYEHSDENFLVFLHAPYGIAMDARFFILVEESIHHILTMEILCQCVLFLDGEEITSTANASTDNDCITGSFLFEAVNHFFHHGKCQSAALVRNLMTP